MSGPFPLSQSTGGIILFGQSGGGGKFGPGVAGHPSVMHWEKPRGKKPGQLEFHAGRSSISLLVAFECPPRGVLCVNELVE